MSLQRSLRACRNKPWHWDQNRTFGIKARIVRHTPVGTDPQKRYNQNQHKTILMKDLSKLCIYTSCPVTRLSTILTFSHPCNLTAFLRQQSSSQLKNPLCTSTQASATRPGPCPGSLTHVEVPCRVSLVTATSPLTPKGHRCKRPMPLSYTSTLCLGVWCSNILT